MPRYESFDFRLEYDKTLDVDQKIHWLITTMTTFTYNNNKYKFKFLFRKNSESRTNVSCKTEKKSESYD